MITYSILTVFTAALQLASASTFPGVIIERDEDLRTFYDYIVVGGGTSGLVVANRLTEDPNVSVLVIEAGILIPNDQEDEILIPRYAPAAGSKYGWGVKSQPIAELGNKVFDVASAKVVGGGSAINGMFFDRGSKEDYDSWEKLGNKGWGWDGLKPYFKKSETFHPPDPKQAAEFGIEYEPKAHGTSGPVQAAFPRFIYPQLKAILDAMRSFGIPVPRDGTNGSAIGAFWVANSLDPKDQTRSYAKTAYHDLSTPRGNYHLMTERQVTKILVDKNKKATGVLFSVGAGSESKQVSAKGEVILAAGAIHTPKLLQLSGIGPRDLLKAHQIPVIEHLPGVGSNFQDHPAMYTALDYSVVIPEPYINPAEFLTNATYNAEKLAEYKANHTGPYTASVGNTASFLPLPLIAPNTYRSLIRISRKSPAATYLGASAARSATVVAGFNKQKQILLDSFRTHKVAVDEFIVDSDMIPLFALQKPLSRGRVAIAGPDPFASPLVEYRTVSNPMDLAILVESVKYSRLFMASDAMAKFKPVETFPGVEVVDDDALKGVVIGALTPSFNHPSCSCPMMERRLGGVVDDKLRVHGVSGLRIVDASVMPLIPASHLSSTVYAVAEKAADIIKHGGLLM